MDVKLSERAEIALEHLPEPDRAKATWFLELLRGFPDSDALKGRVYKGPSTGGAKLFVGRLGRVYRVLFVFEHGEIRVLEVVHHDRLKRFLGWREEGLR